MAAVRSRLDEAAWEAAWAEGRAMTFEKAVENTLSRILPHLWLYSPECVEQEFCEVRVYGALRSLHI